MDNLLLSQLSQPWCITPTAFEQLLAHAQDSNGQPLAMDTGIMSADKGKLVDWIYGESTGYAVINVRGLLFRSPYYYSESNLVQLESNIRQLTGQPNIKGLILCIDSNGGSVYGVDAVCQAILDFGKQKPTYAVIFDGVAASSGYWLASQCQQIIATNSHCIAGSIGTMMSLSDRSEFDKKQGIKNIILRSSKATDKNSESKEAEAGNYKPIVAMLDTYAEAMMSSITQARPNLDVKAIETGKIFFATEAIKVGLIDAVMPWSDFVAQLGDTSASGSKSIATTQPKAEEATIHMFKFTKSVASFLGFATETEVSAETLTTLEGKISAQSLALETVTNAKAEVESKLATATQQLTDLNGKVAELTAKVAELGKVASGETQTPGVGNANPDIKDTIKAQLAGFAHNQE